MESEKKLTLSSSDGQLFVVDESAAVQCRTIKNMVEDDCAESVIPLPNVDSATLAMVIEYCKRHAGEKASSEDLKVFDWEFVDRDQAVLYDLIMAANYLDAKELLDLLCEKVASMIRGKSVEEIRETFKIKNDFTEEEEKAIREENAWAFN